MRNKNFIQKNKKIQIKKSQKFIYYPLIKIIYF